MSKIDLEGWNPILQSIRRWVRRVSKWWRHLPVLFRRRTTWRAERCRHVRKFCSVKSRFTYTVVIITQLTHILLSTWLVSWTEKLDKIHRRNPLRPLTDWVRWFSWWFDHGGSFYSPANQLKRWNNEIKVWMKVEYLDIPDADEGRFAFVRETGRFDRELFVEIGIGWDGDEDRSFVRVCRLI